MLPYIVSFIISIGFLYLGYRNRGVVQFLLYFIAILPPAVIAGCRDLSIGTDTATYPYPTFIVCIQSDTLNRVFIYSIHGLEKGYVILAFIVSRIFPDFNFFLFVSHFLILGILLYAFTRIKINVVIAFTLFYLAFFASSMNISRQFISMSFCILGLSAFIRKEYLFCVLALVLAYFFHNSSLFFITIIILYYLCFHKYYEMKKKSTMAFVSFAVVLGMLLFNEILSSFVDYGFADKKYLTRYGSGEMYGASIPISLVSVNMFNFFMFSFFSKKIKKNRFIVFSNYILLISLLLCFTGLISTFATRLGIYYLMVSIIPMTCIVKKHNQYISLGIISFYVFYWFMVIVVANLSDTYPYSSRILNYVF